MDNSENIDLKKELDDAYTPLSEAKKEIWRRWNNKDLKKEIENYLKDDIPEVFEKMPRAILSRQVQSPNFEMLRFLELTKNIGIRPAFFKYDHDKFVTKNDDKYYLGKLYFLHGLGKQGGRKLSSLKIIDINKYDGKSLNDIKTLWGEKFIKFHSNLVQSIIPEIDTCDITDNYRRNGIVASKYYFYYLSIFICHGILFDNYLLSENYEVLTKGIFLPNFRKVKEKFGLKPLIVRLVPSDEEEDILWRYYPKLVENKINEMMPKLKI